MSKVWPKNKAGNSEKQSTGAIPKKYPNKAPAKATEVIKCESHADECKLLSEIFCENFPQHFRLGFVHRGSPERCYNNILATVVSKAIEERYLTEEIINGCRVVNAIYEQFRQDYSRVNPFLQCVQNYARMLFEGLKNAKIETRKSARNTVRVLGMLFNNDMLTEDMIKVCLAKFLSLAETQPPYLKYFCILLSRIKRKLIETHTGIALLRLSKSRLQSFVSSSTRLSADNLPKHVANVLKIPIERIFTKSTAKDEQLAVKPRSIPLQEKEKEKEEEKEKRKSKFDTFMESVAIFKNQVRTSAHREEFYTIMSRALVEWQTYCMRINQAVDNDTTTQFLRSEMSLLGDNVAIFRRLYGLHVDGLTGMIIISQFDLKILRSSYQLRVRLLESTKFLAMLYNIHKLEQQFIVQTIQYMFAHNVVSNLSLECAVNLLFYTMPKLITSECGIDVVKYMVNLIQKIVKTTCTWRVKLLLADLIDNINRFFPFMHIENEFFSKEKHKCSLKMTFSTANPLW